MNVLTIAGNLGRDAELRTVNGSQGPISVAGFSVAVSTRRKDQNGNEQTLWVDCSLWGKRAEALCQYLTKGSKVTITGEAGLDSYQGQNGFVPKLTLRVNDITLQGATGQQQGGGYGQQQAYGQPPQQAGYGQPAQQPPAQARQGAPAPQPQFDDFDDEIPF